MSQKYLPKTIDTGGGSDLFLHSFGKYSLSPDSMPGSVLGSGDVAVNNHSLFLWSLLGETGNKQRKS